MAASRNRDVDRVVSAIRTAKAHTSGRMFDELHRAESCLVRAAEGRRSSFRRRSSPKTSKKKGGSKPAK